jgi:hypothetical protein
MILKGLRQNPKLYNYTILVALERYNYANWISNIKDLISTSGYVFTLGGSAIS